MNETQAPVDGELYAARQKIYPREIQGRFQRLRVYAVFALLGLYYVLPWIRWGERQAVLFDLPARKFHIFGLTLWPQDFYFLTWLLIIAALALLAGQDKRTRLSLATARERALKLDFAPRPPSFLGTRAFPAYPLRDLVAYIDWTPFFASWDLAGRYPDIVNDAIVGESARSLYQDARAMLDQLVAENWVRASGVIGFWPANRDGDDVILWKDERRVEERARLYTLRQQMDKGEGKPNLALADFVAPAGVADYVGAFAVTAGIGEEDVAMSRCAAYCSRLRT